MLQCTEPIMTESEPSLENSSFTFCGNPISAQAFNYPNGGVPFIPKKPCVETCRFSDQELFITNGYSSSCGEIRYICQPYVKLEAIEQSTYYTYDGEYIKEFYSGPIRDNYQYTNESFIYLF